MQMKGAVGGGGGATREKLHESNTGFTMQDLLGMNMENVETILKIVGIVQSMCGCM